MSGLNVTWFCAQLWNTPTIVCSCIGTCTNMLIRPELGTALRLLMVPVQVHGPFSYGKRKCIVP